MTLELFHVGIRRGDVPLAIRECLCGDAQQQLRLLRRLAPLTAGRLVLSTCERFELYATTGRLDAGAWVEWLADWFHVESGMLFPCVRTLRGRSAAGHLLRVAAGLDSRVIGEPQILGQVRRTYVQALDAGFLDPILSALGRFAIRAGRRVRHETLINRKGDSIARIAVRRLVDCLGKPDGRRVVVVGTGSLATEVAHELRRHQVGAVTIVGRNNHRTALLAKAVHGMGVSLEYLAEATARADALVTCTSSPSYIINRSTIGVHQTGTLWIMDLSVPRNVDPTVARLSGVELLHLDELAVGSPGNVDGVAAAHRIVNDELERFEQWLRQRRVAPIITSIVRNAQALRAMDQPAAKRRLHQRIMRVTAEAAA